MKIKIIEPNRSLLNSLNRYLETKGNTISLAFDGVIAVNEFENDTDLIIIDSTSPRIEYEEVIDLLKKKKENLRVFVILDSFDIPVEILASNLNVDEYFPLPFRAQEFDFCLEKLKYTRPNNNLTIREEYLLELLEKNDVVLMADIDKKIYRHEMIPIYIESINSKLKGKKIIKEEKGFKLVSNND